MKTIIVFSQNLMLGSFAKIKTELHLSDELVFVTTHHLYRNEKDYLKRLFRKCEFNSFADFLSDDEMADVDNAAFKTNKMPYNEYLNNIKRLKNKLVIKKVLKHYDSEYKYILSDDLGIDIEMWKKEGFRPVYGEYYYNNKKESLITGLKKAIKKNYIAMKIYYSLFKKHKYKEDEVYVGKYNGRKYVFLGKMDRIGYRLNIDFKISKEECNRLNKGIYEKADYCTYMTTWHEHGKCHVPDKKKYEVRWAQDGYLPPNYSHKDYYFIPHNVKYYCWDELGTHLFKNQGLPYEIIPFRKKLYLPNPEFPEEIKNVLIVASGSGDWTALKNRSDDDLLVEAFARMAELFPDISFVYRCHPSWVYPENVGVNSINRVVDYFKYLQLPNLVVSSNIPMANTGSEYILSFSRSSLQEDLKKADFVFGEHSISMIDGAFMGIPFCSVNLTNRRNFFTGITELGFPQCNSISDIERVIRVGMAREFKDNYLEAVKNYNFMTDKEA